MKKYGPVNTVDRVVTCIAFAIIMITLTVLTNPHPHSKPNTVTPGVVK